jgi:hypothetical protein
MLSFFFPDAAVRHRPQRPCSWRERKGSSRRSECATGRAGGDAAGRSCQRGGGGVWRRGDPVGRPRGQRSRRIQNPDNCVDVVRHDYEFVRIQTHTGTNVCGPEPFLTHDSPQRVCPHFAAGNFAKQARPPSRAEGHEIPGLARVVIPAQADRLTAVLAAPLFHRRAVRSRSLFVEGYFFLAPAFCCWRVWWARKMT